MSARQNSGSRRITPRGNPPKGAGFSARLEQVLALVSAVVAPLTLITALMFYVGWMRTNALFDYFGVDAALLGFSNQDYILRSVEGLWAPLVGLIVVGILAMAAHAAVRRRLATGSHVVSVRKWARIGTVLGLLVLLPGFIEVVRPSTMPLPTLVYPLCLGAGTAVAAYSRWMWRSIGDGVNGRPLSPPRPAVASTTLVCLLVVSALFWAAGEYATDVGNGLARQFGAALSQRPAVTLYSEKRLFVDPEVVAEADLAPQGGSDVRFRFRYTGLRLLSVIGDRMVLLPGAWNDGQGRAIVLVMDAGLRIELEPGQDA